MDKAAADFSTNAITKNARFSVAVGYNIYSVAIEVFDNVCTRGCTRLLQVVIRYFLLLKLTSFPL